MINSVLVLWQDIVSHEVKLVYLRLTNQELEKAIFCHNKYLDDNANHIVTEALRWLEEQLKEAERNDPTCIIATSESDRTEHNAVQADHFIIVGKFGV